MWWINLNNKNKKQNKKTKQNKQKTKNKNKTKKKTFKNIVQCTFKKQHIIITLPAMIVISLSSVQYVAESWVHLFPYVHQSQSQLLEAQSRHLKS